MPPQPGTISGVPSDADLLTRFCHDILVSLARSDQRRWAEVYVRGLLTVAGRKSIRRISEHVVGGGAEQGLQQFLNQSPWRAEPVRRRLADRLTAALRPTAWVVAETVFPKNGSSSVGVGRQYVPSAGRVMNAQVGLTVAVAGEGGAVPVDWRLLLPPEWDADASRRARAHLPPSVRHRGRWDHLGDMLDEMTGGWGLAPLPVVVDARHEGVVEPLLQLLEQRGLRYVVQVTPGVAVGAGRNAGTLAAESVRQGGTTVNWRGGGGPVCRYVLSTTGAGRVTTARHRPVRHLLAEWRSGAQRPASLWLTNLGAPRVLELLGLSRVLPLVAEEVGALASDHGLVDFEGRSFRGWHHHVTLVSVAYGHALLERMPGLEEQRSYYA